MQPEAALGMLGIFSIIIVGMIALGPIGRALADRLRGKGAGGSIAVLQEQLDEVLVRLDVVQRQLGEVADRQDFAERLLAQARERGLLPGPSSD